jgi:aldehyde dehydrogenase (NAD+)
MSTIRAEFFIAGKWIPALNPALFGGDFEHANTVAHGIQSGNVSINHLGSNAAAPFGGHRDSGLGVECGPEGVLQYCAPTSYHYLTPAGALK